MPSRRKPASPNRRRQAASAPTTSNTTSGQAASPNATTPPKAAVAQHPTISSLKDAKDVKIDSFNATTFGGDNYEIVNKNTYASGANHTSHVATGHSTMNFGAIPASAPAAPSPAPPSEGGGQTLGVPPAQGLFAVPESSLGTIPQGTGDNDVGQLARDTRTGEGGGPSESDRSVVALPSKEAPQDFPNREPSLVQSSISSDSSVAPERTEVTHASTGTNPKPKKQSVGRRVRSWLADLFLGVARRLQPAPVVPQ